MYTPTDFKNGLTLRWKNSIYQVVEFLHVKPGKGAAFVRAKLRNLITKSVLEDTFRMNEQFEPAHIDRTEMQFLFSAGDRYTFMNMKTYEQIELGKEDVGEDVILFLKEEVICTVTSNEGKVLQVELPNTLELQVVDCAPNEKGNTSSGGTKPAKLETGATINVPFFIEIGETIRINPIEKKYQDRVKK